MSDSIRSDRDLIVWQKSMDLFDRIDLIVEGFSVYRRYWLGAQMHRAALSIISNVADGHGADHRGVYLEPSTRAEIAAPLLVPSP